MPLDAVYSTTDSQNGPMIAPVSMKHLLLSLNLQESYILILLVLTLIITINIFLMFHIEGMQQIFSKKNIDMVISLLLAQDGF